MYGAEYTFNVDNGYFEGLVRGFRCGILSADDYANLCQCETLEGALTISQVELLNLEFLIFGVLYFQTFRSQVAPPNHRLWKLFGQRTGNY